MNWFAIGAGVALIALGVAGFTQRSARLSRPVATTIGLVGLFFLILGAAPTFQS
jgi:heme/copper-type cytochrome/quinol oxidase subunit 1